MGWKHDNGVSINGSRTICAFFLVECIIIWSSNICGQCANENSVFVWRAYMRNELAYTVYRYKHCAWMCELSMACVHVSVHVLVCMAYIHVCMCLDACCAYVCACLDAWLRCMMRTEWVTRVTRREDAAAAAAETRGMHCRGAYHKTCLFLYLLTFNIYWLSIKKEI